MAYGYGLRPWELYEFEFKEFFLFIQGQQERRYTDLRQEFQHWRMGIHAFISPYLSKADRGKGLDQLVPDIYQIKERSTETLTADEMYEQFRSKYIQAGLHPDQLKEKNGGTRNQRKVRSGD